MTQYLDLLFILIVHMKTEDYIRGKVAQSHKDFAICKQFLNLWAKDQCFQPQKTRYYFENYKQSTMVLGNGYAYPSFCFQFALKNKNYEYDTRNYCYHGTSAKLVSKILNEGLRSPNGSDIKQRNGSYTKGKAIYTTKIPQHAQIFADPYEWKGKYFQIFFLVRQDISKVKWVGRVDPGSRYANELYASNSNSGCQNMNQLHLLHSKLLNQKEMQWGTPDESSLQIEAVIVKMHDIHPIKGEYRKLSQMIRNII